MLKEGPSISDYTKAVKKLKLDKASGPDSLVGEYFRTRAKYWGKKLWQLENSEDTTLSEGWVAYIWKMKGSPHDPEKYRPITVLNLCYKAIAAAHIDQLNKVAKMTADTAFGFKAKLGCRDSLGFFKTALQGNSNPELSVAYMDLSLAFDMVRRRSLWTSLLELGAPIEMIERQRRLHYNTVMRAFWEGTLGEKVRTN